MKVILREDVYNLGKSGEVVSVRDGYARNYLLPRNLAMLANEGNMRQLEHERSVIEARQLKLKAGAEALGKQIDGLALTFKRKVGKIGETEKLYGSVTALDIAEELSKAGHKIDRRLVYLPEPLKAVGQFDVEVRLHRDVRSHVKVEIVGEAQA